MLTRIRIITTEPGVVDEALYAEGAVVEVVGANVDDVRPVLEGFAEERVRYSQKNRWSGQGKRNDSVRNDQVRNSV